MIQKINVVLLIIFILIFIKFNEFDYSNQKYSFFSDLTRENVDNNNINLFKSNFSLIIPINKEIFNIDNIYFKLTNCSYIYNFRFNIIKVEYNILFYFKNSSFIHPSDLALHYDLHLICHIQEIESNLIIDSIAFLYQNKYFKCIEFVNINEKINFGIIIYKQKNKNFNEANCINNTYYFFNNDAFNYNNEYFKSNKYNQFFYPLFIQKEFYLNNKNISSTLKYLYIQKPVCNTIKNILSPNNEWKFLNIFNHYFCLCRGINCLHHFFLNKNNSTQICKYKFYLNLLEENKNLYNKTDYLLADFPYDSGSLDDAYYVFKKLINLKKNAYYMTINKNILKKKHITFSTNIIKYNFINGDFLEKYFSLLLRLKAVISGAEYFSFYNLFFYIEYITFISLTHGLNYFKSYLFKSYYGNTRYNKIVISSSEKIISLAINNGWKEKDLIKICLPKWDHFDKTKRKKSKNHDKSIFFFFTWRIWKPNIKIEEKLKSEYFKNIKKLMKNKMLLNSLKQNGITLYFCLHHMLEIYKNMLNFGNNNIRFINQNQIMSCIINSNMLVTDFSSIIFEFMYQKKPFVMFIPDSDDLNIDSFYIQDYYDLIKKLKEGSIVFMNKYFSINQVVDKIIYYINNNFKVEQNIIDFYKSFNLTCGNNTNKFINYLENL